MRDLLIVVGIFVLVVCLVFTMMLVFNFMVGSVR